jgi:hypothetical protein
MRRTTLRLSRTMNNHANQQNFVELRLKRGQVQLLARLLQGQIQHKMRQIEKLEARAEDPNRKKLTEKYRMYIESNQRLFSILTWAYENQSNGFVK